MDLQLIILGVIGFILWDLSKYLWKQRYYIFRRIKRAFYKPKPYTEEQKYNLMKPLLDGRVAAHEKYNKVTDFDIWYKTATEEEKMEYIHKHTKFNGKNIKFTG